MKTLGKKASVSKSMIHSYIVPCTSDCYGMGTSVYLGTGKSK